MDSNQKSKCHKIIHTATAAASAAAAGLAQIPGSDTVPITAIQITMIISLGAVFGQEITKSAAKSILGGAVASIGGRTVSQFLVGWIPGLGNAINAATAASITEALGWHVANDFAKDEERAKREKAEQERAKREKAEQERAKRERTERERAEQERAEREKAAQAKKRPHLAGTGQVMMCIIFSVVLAILCMLIDAELEKFTVHFKIWGAVSGIIIAVLINYIIFVMCSNRDWSKQSWAIMPYSNYIALVINIVCASVTGSGKDVHGWDEAVAEFFRTPLLNWGLVITGVLWWFKVDRRISEDWGL